MAEKLTTLAKRLRPFINGQVGAIAATGAFMQEGPGIDLVGNKIGLGGDAILLYNSDGTPVEEFAATAAGLALAIAAYGVQDIISMPATPIVGNITIDKSCTIVGFMTPGAPIASAGIRGTVNITAGSVRLISMMISSNDGTATLTVGNATVYLDGCDVENSGTGRALYVTNAAALMKFENVTFIQNGSVSSLPCCEVTCATTTDPALNEWTGQIIIIGNTTAYAVKLNAGRLFLKDARIANIGTGNKCFQNVAGTLLLEDVQYDFGATKNTGTISTAPGDRGTVYVEDYHGTDIVGSLLTRHLPLPGDAGYVAYDDGTQWTKIIGTSLGTGPHDILSATHTDSDAGDVPVEGDALTYRSSEWVAEAGVDIGSDAADIDKINFNEQAVKPAQPGAGHWLIYPKSDGFYEEDDAGTETKLAGAQTLNDLTDVDTTGVGTGDIIYKTAGNWEDYPLGIGSKVSVTSNKIRFGNSSGGNYLEIDLTTGNLRLVGSATAWDDLRVSASVAKPGATAPAYKAFGPSGNLQALMFEAGHHDEVFFEIQMPHNWKEGSDIHPHVHWTPTTADAGNVVWDLDYSWANIDGTFGAPATMATDARAAGGTAWVHKMDDFKTGGVETISGTGKTLSSMLVCRLHRNSNSGSDTLNKDVALLEFDIHYEVDSFGSDLELVKDASSALLLESGDYLLLENGDNLLLE